SFAPIGDLLCQQEVTPFSFFHKTRDRSPLETIDLLDGKCLRGNPVYAWALRSLRRFARALAWSDFEPAFLSRLDGIPPQVAGLLKLDFILACPGSPKCRRLLIEWLSPPVVQFVDGVIWELGRLAEGEREEVPAVLSIDSQHWHDGVSDASIDIATRWHAFKRAVRGF
ncbi:MAG: hypothetical protein L0191_06165, partial [Acidobacteria bacterium]|nr:hypothetical protein [Acidobacteriota bacterium]